MKLMTLNTHSLAETDYASKLSAFAESLIRVQPDIIALQEVNQTQSAAAVSRGQLLDSGYVPCSDTVIRSDNHALNLASLLVRAGLPCRWTWTPAKTGYGKYDEGLALFSRSPILDTREFYITGTQDYGNWKTRKILGISARTEYGTEYFFSVHMGWWDDVEEPFCSQWERICRGLCPLSKERIWLMGDFNSPAHIAGQGKDLIQSSGWFDSYDLAKKKDTGITVERAIDGWRDQADLSGMRIDYIWSSRKVEVKACRTIFNGVFYPVVSDHFGIITEY